jgi:protein-disulfide isomerase
VNPKNANQVTPRWGSIFEIASTLAMVVLASVLVWQGWTQAESRVAGLPPTAAPIPEESIGISDSATLGAPSARVAMIEYADFECAACASFANNVKRDLIREYVDTGRVLFVFKNLPLPRHSRARAASEAAWCAGRQGRFWNMHDELFASGGKYQDADLNDAASKLGLDLAEFGACRAGGEPAAFVEAERAEAKELGIPATPTFYFGKITADGRVQVSDGIVGSRLSAIKAILDRLLKPPE